MSGLTEEQKQRIEMNRKRAMEKLAATKTKRLFLSNSDVVNPTSQAKSTLSNGTRESSSNFNDTGQFKKQNTQFVSNSFQNGIKVPPNPPTHEQSYKTYKQPVAIVSKDPGPFVKTPLNSSNSQSDFKKEAAISSFYGANHSSSTFPKRDNNPPPSSKEANQRNISQRQITGTFALLSHNRFVVDIGYHQQMIEIFKTIPSKIYDAKTKRWNFDIEHHDVLVEKLKPLQPGLLFSPLPKKIVNLFASSKPEKPQDFDLSRLDPVLVTALMPFQREGVNFGIQRNGKVLIADDMGLGKTIQAMAICNYYKSDWPLLVVTPSSVRYSWAEAFQKWLPSVSSEVSIINTGKDYIPNDQIVLISYDLLTKKKEEILRRGFKSIILDESHFLKNPKTVRTKVVQQIIARMKRIIMLTGTPALSRPSELFPQISALNSKEFSNFVDFGVRYCDGKKTPWGWDFSGSSNMEELQLLLEKTVMIRRLKSEVIKQLPPKIRQVIILDTVQLALKNKVLTAMSRKMTSQKLKGMERRGVLLQYFHESGLTKLPFICEYIRELLEAERKFLCFAHHQNVLDGISKDIEDANVDYIRIDGSTSSEERKLRCDKFQFSEKCKVAVLSITAANAGITLTAAHLVVFAELFWNPGILTQAEDRAHRIGQEDSVVVQYLVARGTADDEIWPLVQRKLDTLSKAGLSKDNFKNSETVKLQKSSQSQIEDFLPELDFDEEGNTPL